VSPDIRLYFLQAMSTLIEYTLRFILYKGDTMLEINVKEARSGFSKLIRKVEQGQNIILTRRGKRVACLVPPEQESHLPSLREFRETIVLSGEKLSSAVLASRDEDRY